MWLYEWWNSHALIGAILILQCGTSSSLWSTIDRWFPRPFHIRWASDTAINFQKKNSSPSNVCCFIHLLDYMKSEYVLIYHYNNYQSLPLKLCGPPTRLRFLGTNCTLPGYPTFQDPLRFSLKKTNPAGSVGSVLLLGMGKWAQVSLEAFGEATEFRGVDVLLGISSSRPFGGKTTGPTVLKVMPWLSCWK